METIRPHDRPPSITLPGLLLGAGFGGLLDGVVLHQILQWHHLLSSDTCCPTTTVRGLEANTLADGLFHLATILLLCLGAALLRSRSRGRDVRSWTGRQLLGLVLQGWGLFNVIEGLVNHQLLGIHHVRVGPHEAAYDAGFLVLGATLMALGHLVRSRAAAGGATSRNDGPKG